MDVDDIKRTLPEHLHRHSVPVENLIHPLAQTISPRVEVVSGFRGVNLAKCHYASSHRERVVVVRARVDEGVGLGRVEAAHDCVSSAERPEGETAAEIFPEASHVGE